MAEQDKQKYDLTNAKIGNFAPESQGSNIIFAKEVKDNTFIGTQINQPPPPTGTPSNLPYSGASYFVGREETLERVHQLLQESSQLAICAVSGMGGIGKTELAVQYAMRHKDVYSGGLCWLQCRAGDVGIQIVNFGRSRLGLTIPEDLEPPDQIGYCWQHWREGQVLLLYDDVTDYGAIAPLLPPRDMSRFKVLLTSRQRAGANYRRIDLDVLDKASALELLRSLAGRERIDGELGGAKALCEWLGYLPLGLELVGRYLQNNSSLSLARMQGRLERAKLKAQAFVPPEQGDMTAKLGLAAALELSWNDERLSAEAKELLVRLSLFAPAQFKWSLVEACYLGQQVWSVEEVEKLREEPEGEAYQNYLKKEFERLKEQGEEIEDLEEADEKVLDWLEEMDESREKLETLRNQLSDRSLLQEVAKGEYRLHPLIREFLQSKQGEIENIDECKRDLCRVMVAIAREIPQTVTVEVIESSTPVVPHLREVGQSFVDWLEDEDLLWPFLGLVRIYEGQSQFAEAERWGKKSLKVTSDRLGERHPLVAYSYDKLAWLYYATGRDEEALSSCGKALGIRLKQLEEGHLHIAQSCNTLALLYLLYPVTTKKYEKALWFQQQALEIIIKQQGERHPNVATCYNSFARLHLWMGRYEEALRCCRQALEIGLERRGKRHLCVAASYDNLARLYYETGSYEKALRRCRKALKIRLKQLGERHTGVASSYNNLAALYWSMERYEEALPLCRQALEIYMEKLGERHPHTVTIKNNYQQMLLESPVEESLKALPEGEREDYLKKRLEHIVFSLENIFNQLYSESDFFRGR